MNLMIMNISINYDHIHAQLVVDSDHRYSRPKTTFYICFFLLVIRGQRTNTQGHKPTTISMSRQAKVKNGEN